MKEINSEKTILRAMPADSPQNTLLKVSEVLFHPTNLNKMNKIMYNPMRQMVQLNLGALESLVTSFIAAEGKTENIPMAFVMFLVERAEDPLRVINIMLGFARPSEG